ncbi:MAG: DnaB-like helicase N-terminal domain-containing protein, partial [Candidatus Puniceispirillum sp.]
MADENSNIKAFPGTGEPGLGRNMPHNLPAEQNLLGAILLDNSVVERIDDRLIADHFYDPLHGRIYATMLRMIERGQLANPVTLKSFFADQDNSTQDGTGAYLAELADGVISITQAPDYASIIYEAHIRRQLILIGDQVIEDASRPDVDVPAQKQIETAEAQLFRLAEADTVSTGLRGFESIITGSIMQADLARKSDGNLSGTSTGLTDLNNLLGGLHKSDLIILAGRPAMGKTALATNIAFHAATTTRTGENAVPVAFFSLEMAAE